MPQQLFIFKRILECNVDLPDVTENYSEKLEADWLEFWTKGEKDIIHTSWSLKYSEFLLPEELVEDNQEINKESTAAEQTTEQSSELVDDGPSWQELWDVHYTELYTKTYQLFEVVHYHHFNLTNIQDLIETSSPLVEVEEQLHFYDQAEQLKALGLPTSFGGRYNKYDKSVQYSSSDFESDEEEVMPPVVLQAENTHIEKKKKKKNRNLRKVPKAILQDRSLRTYWCRRFSLFSRFDEGIQLDRESWFSVTPEKVAIHMAERLRCDTIIDAFCGSGGNSIQFASTCSKVIAIDIDPEKIKNARHNANIYGVADKIDFIIGDYLQLCDNLKGDVVFLSPPWGGPKYISKKEYDIEVSLLPVGASVLAEKSRQICENIVFFLPKNSIPQQIAKLAGIGNRVEIEHNYLDTRLVGLTAIYGDWLINKNNLSE